MSEHPTDDESPDLGTQPLQFRLSHLLVLQLALALGISAILCSRLLAAMAAFAITVAAMTYPVRPDLQASRRSLVDFLAGVVMPVVCVIADPFVLSDETIGPLALHLIIFQLVAFTTWQFCRHRPGPVAAAFASCLFIGTSLALSIGLVIFPLTLIGLAFFGLGVLGITPFLTGYVFSRNCATAYGQSQRADPTAPVRLWFALGAVLALVIPVTTCLLTIDQTRLLLDWLHSRDAALFLPLY